MNIKWTWRLNFHMMRSDLMIHDTFEGFTHNVIISYSGTTSRRTFFIVATHRTENSGPKTEINVTFKKKKNLIIQIMWSCRKRLWSARQRSRDAVTWRTGLVSCLRKRISTWMKDYGGRAGRGMGVTPFRPKNGPFSAVEISVSP